MGIRMWMVDGVTMEVAPRHAEVVRKQECVNVQVRPVPVHPVLVAQHKHVTLVLVMWMVDGVHLEIVVLLVEAECNHVYVDVQHNLEQEQTVLDLRGKPVTLKVVLLDLSMEDGASTPNA